MNNHGEAAQQQNGLYWEAERLIYNTEAELRLLREHRERTIKIFRAQEEALLTTLRGAVEVRDRLKPRSGTGYTKESTD